MMKQLFLALLGLFIIGSRVGFFYAIQGSHGGLFYLKANNLKDISQYLVISALFIMVLRYEKGNYLNIIYYAVITYCWTFSILLVYPFLSTEIATHIKPVLEAYNKIWSIVFTALFLYYLVCIQGKLFQHEK